MAIIHFYPHPSLTLEGATVVLAELRDMFSKSGVQPFVQTDSDQIMEEWKRGSLGRAIRLALLANN